MCTLLRILTVCAWGLIFCLSWISFISSLLWSSYHNYFPITSYALTSQTPPPHTHTHTLTHLPPHTHTLTHLPPPHTHTQQRKCFQSKDISEFIILAINRACMQVYQHLVDLTHSIYLRMAAFLLNKAVDNLDISSHPQAWRSLLRDRFRVWCSQSSTGLIEIVYITF